MKRPRAVHPHLFEINAFAFMERMRRKYGPDLTLATIPRQEWEGIASKGFGLLWLMGIWERSPGSKKCALEHEGLRPSYDAALTGWTQDDVLGSPYAIHGYTVDSRLGTEDELKQVRKTLRELGMGLILDFVPNHLALDHPWTRFRPECFIQGSRQDLENDPSLFYEPESGHILAHGKDPHFPGWTDTVQLNLYSEDARKAILGELRHISGLADGVRCDMAMLMLNDIFEQTWGAYVHGQARPETEFWSEVISETKARCPSFIFLAEAYWDLEYRLQQLGFDYTYDKKLYDLMLNATAREVKNHLHGEEAYQKKCVRFIENHDEPRSVTSFGRDRCCAAAVIMSTIPGVHLIQEGQCEGEAIRMPVQLFRKNDDPADQAMTDFYERIFSFTRDHPFASGSWRLLEVHTSWENNWTCGNLLAWVWYTDRSLKLVCVNYSPEPSQGRICIPHALIQAGPLTFRDVLTDEVYVRTTDEIIGSGLFVELGPWKAHLLDLLE